MMVLKQCSSTADDYDIIGVVGDDNVGTVTLEAHSANAGPQDIDFKTTLDGDGEVLVNYNPTYVKGTVTIEKINLAITVDSESEHVRRNVAEAAPIADELRTALVFTPTGYTDADVLAAVTTTVTAEGTY